MKGTVVLFLFCAVIISQSFAQTSKPTNVTQKPTRPMPTSTPTSTPSVPPAQMKCKAYNITIKLKDFTFSDGFSNVVSKTFTDNRIELEAGLFQAFDGYKPFRSLSVCEFKKAGDGKVQADVYLEFKGNGTHLKTLIAELAKGKLGNLKTDPSIVSAACYVVPPVPTACSNPFPSMCAPDCGSPCCGQYQPPTAIQTPPTVMVPPPPLPPSPPPPPQCPGLCSPMCAPLCAPACCQTAYASPYGKRHRAPKPSKQDIRKLVKFSLKRHTKKEAKQ